MAAQHTHRRKTKSHRSRWNPHYASHFLRISAVIQPIRSTARDPRSAYLAVSNNFKGCAVKFSWELCLGWTSSNWLAAMNLEKVKYKTCCITNSSVFNHSLKYGPPRTLFSTGFILKINRYVNIKIARGECNKARRKRQSNWHSIFYSDFEPKFGQTRWKLSQWKRTSVAPETRNSFCICCRNERK